MKRREAQQGVLKGPRWLKSSPSLEGTQQEGLCISAQAGWGSNPRGTPVTWTQTFWNGEHGGNQNAPFCFSLGHSSLSKGKRGRWHPGTRDWGPRTWHGHERNRTKHRQCLVPVEELFPGLELSAPMLSSAVVAIMHEDRVHLCVCV